MHLSRKKSARASATLIAPVAVTTAEHPLTSIPLSFLRVAAGKTDHACRNAPEWSEVRSSGGNSSVVRGHGDEPFSRIDVSSQGKHLGTVTFAWRRTKHSWLLASQQFQSADGNIDEKVSLDHGRAEKNSADPVVPAILCDGKDAGMLHVDASRAAAGQTIFGSFASQFPVGTLSTAGLSSYGDSGDCDSQVETACYQEKMEAVKYAALMVTAGVAMRAACLAPAVAPVTAPISVPSCIGATAAYIAAAAMWAASVDRYNACIAKANAKSPVCSCKGGGAEYFIAASGAGGAMPTPIAADCGSGASGAANGTTVSGISTTILMICEYVDHFSEDGDLLYREDKGCRYEYIT